jgi:hypothetical protein
MAGRGPFGKIRHKGTCDCECGGLGPCCSPRCEPLYVNIDFEEVPGDCDNPLPLTLAVDFTGTPSIPGYDCFSGSGAITFKTGLTGGTNCWEGDFSGTCLDCNGNTMNWAFRLVLCCQNDAHNVAMVPLAGTACPAATLNATLTTSSCDPFLATGCFPAFGACMVCFDDSPTFTVCFSIYEVP